MMKKSILFVCFMSFMVTIMSATNQKAALPDDSTYAVVNISVCNIRETGDFTSGMTTQALLGMPVRVLKYNGWAQIKTPDEYTG
ncbi:MAG: peptidase, partial [Bacteroidaceae bacterium]